MPIPSPRDDDKETQEEFHSRCMRAIYQEYPEDQANAICYSQWREHHKSIDTGTGLVAYDLQGQRKEASIDGAPVRVYGRIEKVDEMPDGTIKVHGVASTEDVDEQGESVKADAMREAIPDYMRFGALREMHQLSAAGRALECNCGPDNITRIIAHVVDPVAVAKVKHHVYQGFSIGGQVKQRSPGDYKTITGLVLSEISLVDRPANPNAVISLWKARSEPGDRPMSDGNGLGTMEAAWADALAKVGPQIWPCGNQSHRHAKKDEAARCIADADMKKRDRAQVGDPQTAAEAMKARKPFSNAAPPFGAKDGEDGGNADKVGLPGGPPIRPSGGTEKHGLPGEGTINPSEPPGGPSSEANFDGDHDSDDDEESAESAGEGYQPESESERREDFGKRTNGNGKPKGDYGKVPYADPGYQSDGKPRYPIDTEGRVRAAWSYINQPDNARAYSSENLGRVKAKIRSAARRHGIEISEKAIFDLGDQDALIKALADTSLDTQLEELPYDLDLEVISKSGRRQSAADQFMKQWAHDAIGKMTDMAFCQKAEANVTQDTGGNAEHSAPDQGTDSGTSHYRLGENATQDTNKRGARHSGATMGFLKKAHDNLCRAGAACPAHADGMSKAVTTMEDGAMSATTDDEGAAVAQALKKAQKKNDKLEDKIAALTTQVSNLTVHMEYLAKGAKGEPPPPAPVPDQGGKVKKALVPITEKLEAMAARIEQIANTPVPGSASHLPPGIIDISKGQDGGQMRQAVTDEQLKAAKEVKETWQKMSEEEKFFASLKMSHLNPYSQQRR